MAPQKHDAAVERWLRQAVAPVYDAVKADLSRAVPAADAFAAVCHHHAATLKKAHAA